VGTAVAQWLRCCATNRKVAGSIPAGVSGFFIDLISFQSHYGPGGRLRWEYFLGLKAAGLMGGKGLMEEDWNDRGNWRKKII